MSSFYAFRRKEAEPNLIDHFLSFVVKVSQ